MLNEEFEELKAKLDSLSPQEIMDLGYVSKDIPKRIAADFLKAIDEIGDTLSKWADNVVAVAEESKNINIIVFSKTNLGNLRQVLSQKLHALVENEKIESFNDEDANIWDSLESFDFESYDNVSKLRIDLYKKIIDSIGYCRNCAYYHKSANQCGLLEIYTGFEDRCGDFIKIEEENRPAFDVMSEKFIEEQSRRSDAVKINKYTKWSNQGGFPKSKESREEQPEEEGGEEQ